MIFVDTIILIDVVTNTEPWARWSARKLVDGKILGGCVANTVVYAEFAVGFNSQANCDFEFDKFQIATLEICKTTAFLAAAKFREYRRAGGAKLTLLPNFLIGAHALTLGIPLLTRDVRRYRTYFPDLVLIAPDTSGHTSA